MNDAVKAQLLTLKIVVGAMAMGVLAFAVVAVIVIGDEAKTNDPTLRMVLFVLLGVLPLLEIVLYMGLRTSIVRRQRNLTMQGPGEDPTKPLVGSFATLIIIRSAMVEFVGLFACVTYLLTQSPFAIAVAVASVLALLLSIPSTERLRGFVAEVSGPEGLSRIGI